MILSTGLAVESGSSSTCRKAGGHIPILLAVALALVASTATSRAQTAPPAAAKPTAELRIAGAVSTPLVLTVSDLKKMPRKTLTVLNPHDKKTETYEGVLLEELLRKAEVPHGENLRGPAMATYVIAEAEDVIVSCFHWQSLTPAFSTPM